MTLAGAPQPHSRITSQVTQVLTDLLQQAQPSVTKWVCHAERLSPDFPGRSLPGRAGSYLAISVL